MVCTSSRISGDSAQKSENTYGVFVWAYCSTYQPGSYRSSPDPGSSSHTIRLCLSSSLSTPSLIPPDRSSISIRMNRSLSSFG